MPQDFRTRDKDILSKNSKDRNSIQVYSNTCFSRFSFDFDRQMILHVAEQHRGNHGNYIWQHTIETPKHAER